MPYYQYLQNYSQKQKIKYLKKQININLVKYTHEELLEKYSEQLRMVGRVPDALSGAMGNQMYVATLPTKKALDKFYSDVIKENKTRKK